MSHKTKLFLFSITLVSLLGAVVGMAHGPQPTVTKIDTRDGISATFGTYGLAIREPFSGHRYVCQARLGSNINISDRPTHFFAGATKQEFHVGIESKIFHTKDRGCTFKGIEIEGDFLDAHLSKEGKLCALSKNSEGVFFASEIQSGQNTFSTPLTGSAWTSLYCEGERLFGSKVENEVAEIQNIKEKTSISFPLKSSYVSLRLHKNDTFYFVATALEGETLYQIDAQLTEASSIVEGDVVFGPLLALGEFYYATSGVIRKLENNEILYAGFLNCFNGDEEHLYRCGGQRVFGRTQSVPNWTTMYKIGDMLPPNPYCENDEATTQACQEEWIREAKEKLWNLDYRGNQPFSGC